MLGFSIINFITFIAVHYWQKLRVGFETISEDDYLELSINLSERTSSKN